MGDGSFTPYAKFDARAGRWFTKSESGDIDITDGFTAVFDFAQIEVGWMMFAAGVAPAYVVQDISLGVPPKPQGDQWKQGFKMLIALPSSISGGGAREVSSTAKAFIGVIDRLHTEYSNAPEKSEGKLPVLKMNGCTMVETKGPQGVTRNFSPNLVIAAWVDRPATLPKKGAPVVAAAPAPAATPPATGSTAVPPPAPKAAPAAAASMDFG